ncbi:MAG: thioredoxin-disulfide reductase [Peptococcaceae bacterium]|nr:thioredoxin-disulfide reductase [Peptococcaceae bacterium]
MSSNIVYTNAQDWQSEVLGSHLPVIVDFYSEECSPCAALAPIFEKLAEKYSNQMKFVKILRQQNRELALSLNVKSSPTVLFFNQGQEVGDRFNGYIRKPDLRQALENVLNITPDDVTLEKVKADVLILGGGPAGLSAAIYAARARLKTIIVDEGVPGGQAATTWEIANYPGTAGTISGKELMDNMLTQAKSFGTQVDDLKEVSRVELKGDLKVITTEDTEYAAPVLIIATGSESRRLPVDGEADFRGMGIHYCATCDGANYQDAKVIVVGGGNSAVEEAVFLTKFASHVTIVHQFDNFQASKTAQEQALHNPKIDVVWDSEPRAILGDKELTGIRVENIKTGEFKDIAANGVFVYIGMQTRTNLFEGQIKTNQWGYVEVDEELKTNIPGVYAAGDIRSKQIRQVVTAASDGAIAGINAERYFMLQEN